MEENKNEYPQSDSNVNSVGDISTEKAELKDIDLDGCTLLN